MADFTSTQAGNWNDGGTWGNASPGAAGTDYPGLDDDTVVMAHTVTYDAGDLDIDFGNVTINSSGILLFPIAADSTIKFNATGILTVNSGGELRAGTSGSPVGSAYHCYFNWPQGAAGRYVLVLTNGGTINIYGDPAYYGSEKYATLESNWTTGQIFYIDGDYSAIWVAGQKFYIHENIDYDNYLNDGHIYTIDTVGAYDSGNDRTPITISEAAPAITFTATHATTGHVSKLIMLSRNIELCDPAATLVVNSFAAYTERLRFDNNQTTGNSNLHINDAIFYGWDRGCDSGYNLTAVNVVFVSNYFTIYSGTNHQITGDFVSNSYAIQLGTGHQITGDFVSNSYAIHSGTNHQITGDFVSNITGIHSGTNHQITGDFVSNANGIQSGINCQITGDFVSNNYGIYLGTNHQLIGDFLNNSSADAFLTAADMKYSAVLEQCAISGVQKELRIYENSGNFLPLVSGDGDWQAPPSGMAWELQATPNSYCNADSYPGRMELSPLREMAAFVSAAAHTLTFSIYPVGWAASLDQDDILIEARYLAGASGNDRTTVVTAAGTFANAGWRDLTVTFTAGQAGIVYFNLYLKKYESACYVLIDPQWGIA